MKVKRDREGADPTYQSTPQNDNTMRACENLYSSTNLRIDIRHRAFRHAMTCGANSCSGIPVGIPSQQFWNSSGSPSFGWTSCRNSERTDWKSVLSAAQVNRKSSNCTPSLAKPSSSTQMSKKKHTCRRTHIEFGASPDTLVPEKYTLTWLTWLAWLTWLSYR